jgi:hypothetical protein
MALTDSILLLRDEDEMIWGGGSCLKKIDNYNIDKGPGARAGGPIPLV